MLKDRIKLAYFLLHNNHLVIAMHRKPIVNAYCNAVSKGYFALRTHIQRN